MRNNDVKKHTGLLKIFLLSFSFLLLGLLFSAPVKAAEYDPDHCPNGYYRTGGVAGALAVCCQEGSTLIAFEGCVDDNGNPTPYFFSPADKIFCNEVDVLLYYGVGANKCYSEDTRIVRSAGSFSEKIFIGCKTDGSTNSSPVIQDYYLGDDTSAPEGQIEVEMCIEEGGIFVTEEQIDARICACGDGSVTEEANMGGQTCQEKCGTLGVVYDNTSGQAGDACEQDPACAACKANGFTYTALGCIDTSRSGIITWLIRLSIIIVMIAIIFRFVQASMLIRSGDPEKIKEGQEVVTSAIIALILVLVSVPLLEFIGVKVLNIFPEGFITTGN